MDASGMDMKSAPIGASRVARLNTGLQRSTGIGNEINELSTGFAAWDGESMFYGRAVSTKLGSVAST